MAEGAELPPDFIQLGVGANLDEIINDANYRALELEHILRTAPLGSRDPGLFYFDIADETDPRRVRVGIVSLGQDNGMGAGAYVPINTFRHEHDTNDRRRESLLTESYRISYSSGYRGISVGPKRNLTRNPEDSLSNYRPDKGTRTGPLVFHDNGFGKISNVDEIATRQRRGSAVVERVAHSMIVADYLIELLGKISELDRVDVPVDVLDVYSTFGVK